MHSREGSLLGPCFSEKSHLQLLGFLHALRKEDRHKWSGFIYWTSTKNSFLMSFCCGQTYLLTTRKTFLWVLLTAISISFWWLGKSFSPNPNSTLIKKAEAYGCSRSTLRIEFCLFSSNFLLLFLSNKPGALSLMLTWWGVVGVDHFDSVLSCCLQSFHFYLMFQQNTI